MRGLVHHLVDPLIHFNFIDRSLALGSQAFGALIPLVIVVEAAQPGHASIADDVIDRFGLKGAAAATVHTAFTTPTDETTVTAIGFLLLIVSTLSFTRRLQRVYEESWALESRGVRGSGWGLAWIGCFAVYATLHPALDGVFHGVVAVTLSLGGAVMIGLVTPYVLLGRRVPVRRLLPQALLTGIGLTVLGVWTAVYMPHAIGSSAASYGAIGVAFAMLTWLWGLGFVMVCAAVYGSPLMDWRVSAISDQRQPAPR